MYADKVSASVLAMSYCLFWQPCLVLCCMSIFSEHYHVIVSGCCVCIVIPVVPTHLDAYLIGTGQIPYHSLSF